MKSKKVSLTLEDFKRKVDQISDVQALERIAGGVLGTCHPGGGGTFNQFTRTNY